MVPNKISVIQPEDPERYAEPLLAYFTYYEDNKAYTKRESTGINWPKFYSKTRKHTIRILDNDYIEGFELIESVSRVSTSNKLIRIMDPRGFIIELSVNRFVDMCKNIEIVDGVLLGSFKYEKIGNQWTLTK